MAPVTETGGLKFLSIAARNPEKKGCGFDRICLPNLSWSAATRVSSKHLYRDQRSYPVTAGIPDFRAAAEERLPLETEPALVSCLLSEYHNRSFIQLIELDPSLVMYLRQSRRLDL